MARPQKNNCDYFPHLTTMRNHRKVKMLRNNFGQVQGYAFWSMMLEILTESDGCEIENSEIEMEMFASELGVAADEIKKMIEYSRKIELLFEANGFIYSESLNECLAPVWEKRKQTREVSHTRQRRQNGTFEVSATETPQDPVVTVTEIPQSKVKYSILEKSKVNNTNTAEKIEKSDFGLNTDTETKNTNTDTTATPTYGCVNEEIKTLNTLNTEPATPEPATTPTVDDTTVKGTDTPPDNKPPKKEPKPPKATKEHEPLIMPWTSEAFIAAWAEWIKYRIVAKKGGKYSANFVENKALNHLKQLSTGDECIAIQIIDQSISNNWQGLFLLPAEKYTTQSKTHEPDGRPKSTLFVNNPKPSDFDEARAAAAEKRRLKEEKIGEINKTKDDGN